MVSFTHNDLNSDLSRRHKPTIFESANDCDVAEEFSILEAEGYVVLENILDETTIEQLKALSGKRLANFGRNAFEGEKTQRLYNILAHTRVFDPLVTHPKILALMGRLFHPNFLLSQAQLINIHPGEKAQLLHFDDGFYKIPRPRPALGAATIWALDDFTAENGATVVISGSHKWDDQRIGKASETVPVIMPAGSVVVFLGTTWHGGGANSSGHSRLAATCQYCQPYLRQQENFFLEIDNDTAKTLSPELLSLIGYSIYPPFMGMVDGKHPKRVLEK